MGPSAPSSGQQKDSVVVKFAAREYRWDGEKIQALFSKVKLPPQRKRRRRTEHT